MTILPGDKGLDLVYPQGRTGPDKLAEVKLGNPAATPAMIASWQVQEAVKVLLNKGELIRNRLLYFDALHGEVQSIELQ